MPTFALLASMEYAEFLIKITALGNQYAAEATANVGDISSSATDYFELDDELLTVALPLVDSDQPASEAKPEKQNGAHRGGDREIEILTNRFNPFSEAFGIKLYERLFGPDIVKLFTLCESEIRDNDDLGLRITLKFDLKRAESEYLFSLPWELIQYEQHFYNLYPKTPVVRHVEVTNKSRRSIEFDDTVHVLILAANPEGTAKLNLDVEIKKVLSEIGKSMDDKKARTFEYTLVEKASKKDLKEGLRANKYDIIHYLGHGIYHTDKSSGALIFEKDNKPEFCYSSTIGKWAREADKLKLFFLNACETALTGKSSNALSEPNAIHEPYSGVAPTLIQAGVPAVLAMQRPIEDDAAVIFSQAFYEGLVNGYSLETCVTEARNCVQDEYTPDSPEWATPVLFLRVRDGGSSRETSTVDLSGKMVYIYYKEEDKDKTKFLEKELRNAGIEVLESRKSDSAEDHEMKLDLGESYIVVVGEKNPQLEFLKSLKEADKSYLRKPRFLFLTQSGKIADEEIKDRQDLIKGMDEEFIPDEKDLESFMEELAKIK